MYLVLPKSMRVCTSSYWKILKLALPVGVEGVFQTSFSLIDQVIVARLGADAVAGVGLSNSISFILLLFYSAIGIGSAVLIAQAFGRKNMDEVSAVAAAGHIAAGFLGVCTAIPLILYPEVILRWIGAQGDVAKQASGYFRLFAASAPLIVISAVTTGTFRSLNDTTTPMIVSLGAVAFNTLAGFLLVLGIAPFPKLGAGVATLLAQSIRCCLLMTALYGRKEGIKWRWPWQGAEMKGIFGQLFRTTYPLALSEMLWGVSAFLYTVVFTRLGTTVLAGSQIVMVIENLFIVAASGLAPAAVASIGQAIGAGSIRNAKTDARIVLRLAALAGLLFTSLLIGASFLLPALYPQVGDDVLRLAFWGLLIAAFVQPAKVLNSVLGNGILPSGKDTKFVDPLDRKLPDRTACSDAVWYHSGFERVGGLRFTGNGGDHKNGELFYEIS
jgi:putative MATE family efflux protein